MVIFVALPCRLSWQDSPYLISWSLRGEMISITFLGFFSRSSTVSDEVDLASPMQFLATQVYTPIDWFP